MINWKRGGSFLSIVAVGLGLLANATNSMAQEKKYKVYLAIGVSGHAWINAAANMIKALAATPPYDKQIELHEIISGPDSQKQISDFESMIASGRRGDVPCGLRCDRPIEIPQPLWGPGVGIESQWHPRWCASARCEYALGGAHTSRPFVIRSDATSDVRASVRVWEQREMAYEPATLYVELILGNHASNERIRADLSLAQTRTLIDALRDALDRIDVTELATVSTAVSSEPDGPR